MPHRLNVIIASTRPGRVGLPVGKWAHSVASQHAAFDAQLVDLAEVNLPLFDEPQHPRFRNYTHEHTKKWSAIVDAADAFVVVTPEYNYSCPPSLVNAFDYLFHEWSYKPIALVSYGGISGGLRAAQMTKLIVTTLRMMPIPDGVPIPMVSQFVKDGEFQATDVHVKSMNTMLDELSRWTTALATMRTKAG